MGIEIEWFDDKKRILVWHFPEGYDWDDLVAALDANEQMLEGVDHVIDSIMDLTQNHEGPPPGLLSQFPKLAGHSFQDEPHMTVMVGARGLADTFGRIFSKLYMRLVVTDTMDEALTAIREYRSTEGQ
jgi:hypothetical protein